MPVSTDASAPARQAFLNACAWDVAVRKPGNVSRASPGHGMLAQAFVDSAQACAAALCERGATVGARIEGAVAATWACVGCNTNLGIVLLCAPLAAAFERVVDAGVAVTATSLRDALQHVLAGLDVADAEAAFRAIVMASPGGLGDAPDQDVHQPPTMTLRQAMALAADRDRIARQYRDGYAELFDLGLPAIVAREAFDPLQPVPERPAPAQAAAVQRVYLAWLASDLDSHIVRKHGAALAHSVLRQAAPWAGRAQAGEVLDGDAAFAQWDQALKSASINPGTSADLSVLTLMCAGLLA
ncbi:triphosphoribosyl-dephospho-CoA protein [Leptothrix cholodnii SP-6]|uniref:Triphosphoribosyl-dephospho-CoA protein n=1 Tax=Leptothrix cholodnii (strain ATCC 51168 / LMG 8142 / SP-6) TaxID=395495 RepID=B1Y0Z1_LEPCP|nr:triphosphoribosyl-dephospho-CoA synthase [Leptothrix cholodnii]ACB35408.1 triphosphoribosyl-dephospho-CoA protein [Leptothrix cholodnii SP-6]